MVNINQPVETKRLLTKAEAAERLHCSEQSVYRYIKAGLFPALRIRSRVLISEQSLNEFLEGC